MPSRHPKTSSPRSAPSRWPVPVFLVAAFLLGVATSWVLLRGSGNNQPPPAIQSFLPPASATAATAVPSVAPTDAEPPNVAGLPAAEGARVLGNWNYDRRNWAHAVEHYQQALAGGLDNPDIRTDLGNCYRFLNQPDKALEQYQLAQKQNPQHENSLFNQISLFADLLHDKARSAAAARDFLTRFPLSPQVPKARQLLEQAGGSSAPSPK